MNDQMKMIVQQMTDQCFRRWRDGQHLADNVREHSLLYFSPSSVAHDYMKQITDVLNIPQESLERVHKIYTAIIEANRAVFLGYNDEQADAAYQQWLSGRGEN
jgi:hypothetical protein